MRPRPASMLTLEHEELGIAVLGTMSNVHEQKLTFLKLKKSKGGTR